MTLFGFGNKKGDNKERVTQAECTDKKPTDPAMAEEFCQKFQSPAKEDNIEALAYLQKAAALWHEEAVKRAAALYATVTVWGSPEGPL